MKKIVVLPFLAGFLAGLLSVLAALEWARLCCPPADTGRATPALALRAEVSIDRHHLGFIRPVMPVFRQRVVPVVLRERILPSSESEQGTASGKTGSDVVMQSGIGTLPAPSAVTVRQDRRTSANPRPVPSSPKPADLSAKARYAHALACYDAGRYAQAREEFAAFARAFPQSPLMPNALYWTGETWYAQQRFGKAAEAFAQVVRRYPRHAKSPDALLKQAYSVLRSGDPARGRRLLDNLEARYPKSRASLLGRRVLQGNSGYREVGASGIRHG